MASLLPQIRVSDFHILNHWDLRHVNAAMGQSIPGYRYSATFLTTLRSNLQLSACAYDSPPGSKISTPTVSASLAIAPALLTPSPLSISSSASEDHCPAPISPSTDLLSEAATCAIPTKISDDCTAALNLIADSVDEQRYTASKAVASHPAVLAGAMAVFGILARFCSWPALLMTGTCLITTGLAGLRWWTWDYVDLAEDVGWGWLQEGGNASVRKHGNGRTDDPIVLVTKWGGRVIGVVIMRVSRRERKGYIRAWTVESSCRNQGVGRALLEEATRTAWGRGARGMEFEVGHANSYRALPGCFNRGFDRAEVFAQGLLAGVMAKQRREKSSR